MTLTREEILAMEPGRELDELICNQIFELEMVAHVHYSTDISAAWEVLEKMKQRWHDFNIGRHNGKWSVGWNYTDFVENINSAPEAIGKASLLAGLNL
ncbi:BC1872 family protein [Paenibacillus rhizophilus]|uniref:Phage ABA sandwich domain-containing protein n=1 Tax=Paenibacillus rhizophilus TaxID=1850366 RepID=A0A3N9P4P1_9BACL|nr:hypothetical protein [Paenibacillus rhizophilus]RQW10024.1 hypothetical protein EH198_16450 [Paenibacillus rhizophilus]